MTNTQPSRLPMGVSGKSTAALNSTYRVAGAADADCIAGVVGSSSSHVVPATCQDILNENEVCIRHNDTCTDHRAITSDVIEDDEPMLDVLPEESSGLPDPHPINMNTPMIDVFRDYTALMPGLKASWLKYCPLLPKFKWLPHLVLHMENKFECICNKYRYGRPHPVSRSTWYQHIQEAGLEEERPKIRLHKKVTDGHLADQNNASGSQLPPGAHRTATIRALAK
ncbi:hypothetical protein EDD22DRAFT_1008073 [Suillus occidentalis]|nr:hypothetical protein EDD22DRAFT_1008073 [Suillus occidentalis]